MPTASERLKAENGALFLGARACRMSQRLPENRHDARMWAQLGPLSDCQYEEPATQQHETSTSRGRLAHAIFWHANCH